MCNLLKITGILMRFTDDWSLCMLCRYFCGWQDQHETDSISCIRHTGIVCLMMCFLLSAFFQAFSTGTVACTITECQWVLFEPSCYTCWVASHLSSWGIEAHLGSTFSETSSFPSSAAQLSIKQQFHYGTLWHFLNLTYSSQLRSSN